MIIEYKNKSFTKDCGNKNSFEKKYSFTSFKKFKKAKNLLIISKNIFEAKKNKGLNIKKLKGLKNTGSFRLSKDIRVNFEYKNSENFLEVEKITIVKIHFHKY